MTSEEASQLAKEIGACLYLETSAKTLESSQGLEKAFHKLANQILNQYKHIYFTNYDDGTNLGSAGEHIDYSHLTSKKFSKPEREDNCC